MKKQILDRYTRTRDNKIIIDISAGKIESLFNNLDKHAPYVKKELDQDLVEYIIESVSEIGKENFIIHFRITTPTDASLILRVESGIHNYFIYLRECQFRKFGKMKRTSLILFLIGVTILSLSVWLTQKTSLHNSVIADVFAEGLNVAAWVSLWNAIATFLINWAPHCRKIDVYDRIAKATIIFNDTKLM